MDQETLYQYRRNKIEIAQIREEIETLRSKFTSPATQKLTGMPMTHGGVSDPTGNGAAAVADLCRMYDKRLKEMCAQQKRIEEAINTLKPTQRMIVRARYIQGYEWEKICYECGYSWAQTHRYHKAALRVLEKIQ